MDFTKFITRLTSRLGAFCSTSRSSQLADKFICESKSYKRVCDVFAVILYTKLDFKTNGSREKNIKMEYFIEFKCVQCSTFK